MIVTRHTIAKEEWEAHTLTEHCKCEPDIFRQRVKGVMEVVVMHNLLESHRKPCEYHTQTFDENGKLLDRYSLQEIQI